MSEPRPVVILNDPASPLLYVRCAEPCQPTGWCQHNPNRPDAPGICWLSSGRDRGRLTRLIEACGRYKVVAA